MQFTVNGKDYDLNFGVGFVRKMDDLATVSKNGVEFGVGFQTTLSKLLSGNVASLSDVIRCAIKGKKFKQTEIDDAIDEYADVNGELDTLFDEVEEELGKKPSTQKTYNMMKENIEEATKEN